jgi:predicted O-linked N-acetylglucosamine transferase (SPINDLY family)
VTYPNAPLTTGLGTFDAILSDLWASPPGSEDEYTEPVIRLDPGYIAWQPPPEARFSQPSLPRDSTITFGVFQRAAKITESYWDLVARILASTGDSRILIQQAAPDLNDRSSAVSRQLLEGFTRRGISEHRVELAGARDLAGHFDAISRAEVALDTFPYNGHATTCSCLWMGTPVITLRGNSHAARVGASLLCRSGLPQWVADSPEDFVAKAVRCAEAVRTTPDLRTRTHRSFASSSICDGSQIAQALEGAYRHLWRRWCAGRRKRSEGIRDEHFRPMTAA